MIMLALLGISFIFELWLVVSSGRKSMKITVLAAIALLLVTFASSSYVISKPSIAAVFLVFFSAIRIVNIMRVAEARMRPEELRKRSFRTFCAMLLLSAFLVSYIIFLDKNYAVSVQSILYAQILVASLLAVSVVLARYIYRYRPAKELPKQLPTLSVCIPARNETSDLPACIESVLSSTYQKLEIIVLDDCSHDKTPEIVKKYAHSGVRFVNGKEPREDWLAKNAAYDRLADEATGDVLLFIGVDVRLKPETVQQIVSQLGSDDMISVLPKRASAHEAAVFIQPLRYWWELGLWRFSLHSPPVLSTCWAIRRNVLNKYGTFESVKKAVEPEAVFARKLAVDKKYAFLVANETVGIESTKAPTEQYQTALRKRYPQVRRRPETLLAVILFELVFIVLPFVLLIWLLVQGETAAALLALMACMILSFANAEVYKLSLKRLWPIGFVSIPFLALSDWVLIIRSMYGYEFDKIIWKERNICLPLLSVEKSLPPID